MELRTKSTIVKMPCVARRARRSSREGLLTTRTYAKSMSRCKAENFADCLHSTQVTDITPPYGEHHPTFKAVSDVM